MKILAFDNSTSSCVVAVQNGDAIFVKAQAAPMQQAKLILPAIDNLLREAKLSLADLDVIAFGCGPGSFTGVRIATSVGQSLAYASNKPLVAISSLAFIAQSASMYSHPPLSRAIVCTDARMNEVYYGDYQFADEGVELVGHEKLLTLDELKKSLNSIDNQAICLGDGWTSIQDELGLAKQTLIIAPELKGEALLKIAKKQYQQRKFVAPNAAFPVYLR
jgi:tRNA threonylcarbamoyladenosine biosynthesis protein TsaB